MSTRTVEANLTRINRELGIRSRSQLVAAFHDRRVQPADTGDSSRVAARTVLVAFG